MRCSGQRELLVRICSASKYSLWNTSLACCCATVYSPSVNLRIYCADSVSSRVPQVVLLYFKSATFQCHECHIYVPQVSQFHCESTTVPRSSATFKCHECHILVPRVPQCHNTLWICWSRLVTFTWNIEMKKHIFDMLIPLNHSRYKSFQCLSDVRRINWDIPLDNRYLVGFQRIPNTGCMTVSYFEYSSIHKARSSKLSRWILLSLVYSKETKRGRCDISKGIERTGENRCNRTITHFNPVFDWNHWNPISVLVLDIA